MESELTCQTVCDVAAAVDVVVADAWTERSSWRNMMVHMRKMRPTERCRPARRRLSVECLEDNLVNPLQKIRRWSSCYLEPMILSLGAAENMA